MPEGPEAKTVSDKLRPHLVNNVITDCHKDERAKTIGFFNLKCPITIIDVRSYGKKVIIDINNSNDPNDGYMIIISLGMSGRLQYSPGNHSHISFDISTPTVNGPFTVLKPYFSLYFDDTRYMGSIDIIPNPGVPLYFKDIGPDLLQAALDEKTWITREKWLKIFKQNKIKNRAICDVLLDQDLIAGIGNYLKSEILYYSGIHPNRDVKNITDDEWERIRINAHKIILLSYSYGGFTIESFISPDGSHGLYPAAVYGKTHDPLGNPIIKMETRDKRTSHFVPSIQI